MIPPEFHKPTPADQFEAALREADAREAAKPRRLTRPRSTWLQLAVALALGLALWAVILAGLSRAVFGWP
ncbi:hypothetical protein [Methylobacterium radiodurans]|uniref:Uncharacterized protein n=1 Tax=Methylobacterium radiodurans TaxID=2202828 RepID=A0A2U8VQA0_9HYPH|nr:hypothetical protein [Methylobacterium radiodurans]AWN35690.1 hypothetical protein DK427_07990 [Methylobacterium radiodurans]